MKITFLGTDGWYDAKTGNTICTLIESKDYYIIFDAGDGIYKLDRYIKKDKPIYLFLSHLHIDHISGLHILNGFNFKQGVDIFLEKGKKSNLQKIINHPFTIPFKDYPFRVDVHELPKSLEKIPFPLEVKNLFHEDSSIGFRMKIDGKIIVYCCDTGVCDNDFKLAKGADVLIHECSLRPRQNIGTWGHTNPGEAARLARKAKVKKLFLTHFSASAYTSARARNIAKKRAKEFFSDVVIAEDGLIEKI